jgi:electron transfer flavoprotein alpha subunit
MDFSYLDDWADEAEAGEVVQVGEGYRNIWVLAETSGAKLVPGVLEAMGQARNLADQIGVYVYGVLIGQALESLGQELFAYGADKVLVASHPNLTDYQPEAFVHVLGTLVDEQRPEILLMAATPLGNDLSPRLAQRLNTGLISHCVRLDLDMSERLLLGTFQIMGGEVYHTAACPKARPQMATLELGHFATPYPEPHRSGDVQSTDVDLDGIAHRIDWLGMDATMELPEVPLSRAKVIVAAGRGLRDADGFALAEKLAAALGGVVAGTRGAFEKGWIPEEAVIGVAGTSVAPDLYVACALSGDIYHSFGLQGAKFVIAINTDESAPVMERANVAVVGDARQVIPGMLETLEG